MGLDVVLRYAVHTSLRGDLEVLPVTFGREFLELALPPGTDLRAPIDRALLRAMHGDGWPRLVQSYLGSL